MATRKKRLPSKKDLRDAKDWPPKPANKTAGVNLLVELMYAGQYERGDCRALCVAWNMNLATLRVWSAEAARMLRSLESDDDVLADAELRLKQIMSQDKQDRVAAIKLRLEARGLLVRKHEHRDLPSEEDVDKVLLDHGIQLPEKRTH